MNVLITGSDSQLGIKIKELSDNYKDFKFIFLNKKKLDINDKIQIDSFFEKNNISILINCAAYTAVDNAEDDYESAYRTNCLALKNIANKSIKHNFKVIHISTDYVFDGTNDKPYTEEHPTNPINLYGKSKLEGEKILSKITPLSIIIRTSWLYSEYGNNFLKTMLKLGNERQNLKVVNDQIGTPTYAEHLADAILIICEKYLKQNKWHSGIYHYSNTGLCSWYDFAKEIFKLSRIKISLTPVSSDEFPTKAARPMFSVLNKSKIKKEYNIKIIDWKKGLKDCLNKIYYL